jgi:phosphatidate cytidylyltransferase
MASELTRRVAVAAIGIPLAVAVVSLGGWVLAILLGGIAAAATAELYRLARHRGIEPLLMPGMVMAVMPVLAAAAGTGGGVPDPAAGRFAAAAWSWHFAIAISLLACTLAIFARGTARAPLAAIAVTVFGALFAGGTLAYAVLLRGLPVTVSNAAAATWVGPALLAFPLTLTWLNDTFAYFGGRRFGRRKLIPAVSPGKTVEGAISGLFGTAVTGAFYAHFVFGAWLGVPLGVLAGGLIGLVISPIAQLGDLAESLLKREAGVKDSGALLPGHGGVLDRFDSLFFTIPVTFWLLSWMLTGSVL